MNGVSDSASFFSEMVEYGGKAVWLAVNSRKRISMKTRKRWRFRNDGDESDEENPSRIWRSTKERVMKPGFGTVLIVT